MGMNVQKKDGIFLFLCIGLGILAELSFLHGRIGLSYLVFISGFYLVVFLRFRLEFNHRRIGLLLMVVIWILSGSYLIYDHALFYNLNLFMIPILVFAHTVLITRPNTFKWNTPHFVLMLFEKLREAHKYVVSFNNSVFRKFFKNMGQQTGQIVKRIMIGLGIGIPLLCVITVLLMSADTIFENAVMRLPRFMLELNFIEGTFRFIFIICVGLLFFGVFQVLQKKTSTPLQHNEQKNNNWDSITAITILFMLNSIYLIFVVIQFRYFFNHELLAGVTYATYARRGFFELVLVTLINWTILISLLKKVIPLKQHHRLTLNILYSILIVVSGVILASAYQRLSLYEAAYGFTMARILAHTFMIFLMVIFAYTLIRVWIERISLTHFYLIIGLIFYTALNVVNVEQMIVDNNLKRYEQTGKIDLEYLNTLSYTGLNGLIRLYESHEHVPELQKMLLNRQQWEAEQPKDNWQSFNFAKQEAVKKLKKLDLQ